MTGIPSPDELSAMLNAWAQQSGQFPRFAGGSQYLPGWFLTVEGACTQNRLPVSRWTEAAIHFLDGDLKHVMEERKLEYITRSGEKYWSWEDFKNDIRRLIEEAEKIQNELRGSAPTTEPRDFTGEKERESPEGSPSSIFDDARGAFNQFKSDHPFIAASAGTGLAIGGSIVLIPALGILALNAIGFTGAGVAAGSLAAALQSIFYGGATGGLFAILQSIGATAVLPAAGAVITSALAAGGGVAALVSGNTNAGSADEEDAGNEGNERNDPTGDHAGPGGGGAVRAERTPLQTRLRRML